MLFLFETPIFLYKQGKTQKGDKVLARIYSTELVSQKKRELSNEVESVKIQSKDNFFKQCKNLFTHYGRCVFIGVGL